MMMMMMMMMIIIIIIDFEKNNNNNKIFCFFRINFENCLAKSLFLIDFAILLISIFVHPYFKRLKLFFSNMLDDCEIVNDSTKTLIQCTQSLKEEYYLYIP